MTTIIRILHEGQYEVDDSVVEELNELDEKVLAAYHDGDQAAFSSALAELNSAVRSKGTPVPVESHRPSDLHFPPDDLELEEAAAYLSEDGIVPGRPATAVEG